MSSVETSSISKAIAGFFAELQRRRVLHIGGIYIAGAWLGAEIVSFLLEQAMAPAWSFRLLAIVFVVGFPVAMSLAWVVQVQPDGSWAIDPSGGQRRTIFAAIALGLLATAGLSWLILPGTEDAPLVPSYQPLPNSVAVLAFKDMSPEKNQEYFADGIAETMIHVLAQVSGLKVTAQTSSFYFKGKDVTISEIAEKLQVAHVLEGSVQKSGNRIRVIAQLINAGDGTHLWSKSFNRDLEDIFAIQDEIAREVVMALKVTLLDTEEERLVQRYQPTLEAYEQLTLGRQEMSKRTSVGLAAAEQHFKKAIELDPGYALAYVGLADTYNLQAGYSNLALEESIQRRQRLIEKALELDPLSGEAYTARARIHQNRLEFEAAEEGFLRSIELNPNYATARLWYGVLLRSQGRYEEYLTQIRLAAILDPLAPVIQHSIAEALWNVGRAEEALTKLQHNIEQFPELFMSYWYMADFQTVFGRLGVARRWYEEARKRDPTGFQLWRDEFLGLLNLGDLMSAEVSANKMRESYPEKHAYVWYALHLYRGDWNAAISNQESALERQPGNRRVKWHLADLIARQGDVDRARHMMAEAFPEYLEDGLELGATDLRSALTLAAILHVNGERQQRDALLLAMEEQIATMHRIRGHGYGTVDVYIHAMRGDRDRAIASLREAIDMGWRASIPPRLDSWWTLRHDWKLGSLTQDPEFITLMEELETDISKQRQWYEENKDKPLL